MKIAALYDIHGNYPALKAISEQLVFMKPDLIVLGGDIVSGPMPLETLGLISKLKSKFKTIGILGNNDQDTIDAYSGKTLTLSERSQEQIEWIAERLTAKHILELKKLPINATVGNYFFCHAVASDNMTIFTKHSKKTIIKSLFQGVKSPFIICGHTHLQFEINIDKQKIINAGSVGMPFSDQEGAQWLWIENQKFDFKRTLINKDKAIKDIQTSNYPYINEFIKKHVVNNVPLDEAYKMLEHLIKKD